MKALRNQPPTRTQAQWSANPGKCRGVELGSKPTRRTGSNYEAKMAGCQHYVRKCSFLAPCCHKIYPCRFCHDAAEQSHELDRKTVQQVQCDLCGALQNVVSHCRECGIKFGFYFCSICDCMMIEIRGNFTASRVSFLRRQFCCIRLHGLRYEWDCARLDGRNRKSASKQAVAVPGLTFCATRLGVFDSSAQRGYR